MYACVMGFGEKGFYCEKPFKLEEIDDGYYFNDFDIVFTDVGLYELNGDNIGEINPPLNQDSVYFVVAKTRKQAIYFCSGFNFAKTGVLQWSADWVKLN